MSLVSYADSDENSDNDPSETEDIPSGRVIEKGTHEPTKQNEASASRQLRLPLVKRPDQIKEPDVNEKTAKPKSIGNLFSSLPAPWMSSVSWASKDGTVKKNENKAHSVKISLPVAEESDSEDEALPKQEKKQNYDSQKSSGLFCLLPKPKNSVVVKEKNPNRPVTKVSNRLLIPDSLRRKQAKKTPVQRKKQMLSKEDSDEDDDEESASFFSLEAKESTVNVETSAGCSTQDMKLDTKSVGSNDTPTFTNPSSIYVEKYSREVIPADVHSSESFTTETAHYPYFAQHSTSAPLENPSGFVGIPGNQVNTTAYLDGVDQANPNYSFMTTEPNYNYAQSDHSTGQYGAEWQPQVEKTPQNTYSEHTEQLKKLQGKRGRGEENINIIDVNADDQVGSSSDWKSRYQQDDTGYQPQSKKKENLPSSQQRRKHQITYLAFQAKESEWELRNQWATNSQTRQQTQSKYGF